MSGLALRRLELTILAAPGPKILRFAEENLPPVIPNIDEVFPFSAEYSTVNYHELSMEPEGTAYFYLFKVRALSGGKFFVEGHIKTPNGRFEFQGEMEPFQPTKLTVYQPSEQKVA